MAPRCPICREHVSPRPENPAYPFCCERCRLVDLGNWLGERYRLPVREPDEDQTDASSVGDEDR